jgi:4-diphosphocytidyl-2-C-methyl-D-erythritol kinase
MEESHMHSRQPETPTHATHFTRAYAKINLTLDVLGLRPDGYHDLRTIMQTIDLHDTICLTRVEDEQVHLSCSVTAINTADNLAVRAAQLVQQRFAIKQGVMIEIVKRIPIAAGLGGGSSDAAAVLLALHQWWQLEISPAELLEMAALLGSDVPFFLTGGLALCEGRGEHITNLSSDWPPELRWLLLLKPALSVSTATVFRNLPASDYTDGSHSRAVLAAFATQQPLASEDLHNSLERNVLTTYLPVARAREDVLEAGAPLVRLSGSGPTLFAPFSALEHARQVQKELQKQGYEVYLTRPISARQE